MSETSGTGEWMLAAVIEQPGPPEVLTVRRMPRPVRRPGWALVQVHAFELNRSELFTRQGHSPTVRFPRVPGIECVGVVAEPGDAPFPAGTTVAAAMGGMGRAYDGGYAEYVLLPVERLMPVRTTLPWEVFGALPETYLTAHYSLRTLRLDGRRRLLVRAATSSVGMAAVAMASADGLEVAATTRNPAKAGRLRAAGAAHVLLDDGEIDSAVRAVWPEGADGILDLIGGRTLLDTMRAAAPGGVVCNTGILGGTWTIDGFEPLEDIPSGVHLTVFGSSSIVPTEGADVLQLIADAVAEGRHDANLERVLALEDIADAHRFMEENRAAGKLVVRVRH